MSHAKTALICGSRWMVMACPEPLPAGCDYQNDHADRVIWLSPGLSPWRRERVIAFALERAAREAEAFAPLVG